MDDWTCSCGAMNVGARKLPWYAAIPLTAVAAGVAAVAVKFLIGLVAPRTSRCTTRATPVRARFVGVATRFTFSNSDFGAEVARASSRRY